MISGLVAEIGIDPLRLAKEPEKPSEATWPVIPNYLSRISPTSPRTGASALDAHAYVAFISVLHEATELLRLIKVLRLAYQLRRSRRSAPIPLSFRLALNYFLYFRSSPAGGNPRTSTSHAWLVCTKSLPPSLSVSLA